MSSYSQGNSFSDILTRLLSNIDDSLDKREGSIIYDALAPAAAELAQCYIALDVYTDQTYLLNAVGENLDNRVMDYGLSRKTGSHAERLITVYDSNNELMEIEIGARFSIPNAYGGYNFTIIEKTTVGNYVAECETIGEIGNDYVGELLPLTYINNMGTATIGEILKPGEDAETDDELRKRALAKINQEAFAGNKAAYQNYVEEIDGVEACKVFPVWNGGGTVKLAVVASGNTIPSADFIQSIQTEIDPISNQGQGLGMAPIGHKVTVVAPDKLTLNINATITIDGDYSLNQLEASIKESISNYIEEVQSTFADEDILIVYTSRLIASILNVAQVKNVSKLTINGQSTDLEIALTGTNVKFPMLGEVVLSES